MKNQKLNYKSTNDVCPKSIEKVALKYYLTDALGDREAAEKLALDEVLSKFKTTMLNDIARKHDLSVEDLTGEVTSTLMFNVDTNLLKIDLTYSQN